jgi:hypothetical protein
MEAAPEFILGRSASALRNTVIYTTRFSAGQFVDIPSRFNFEQFEPAATPTPKLRFRQQFHKRDQIRAPSTS